MCVPMCAHVEARADASCLSSWSLSAAVPPDCLENGLSGAGSSLILEAELAGLPAFVLQS